ncbi:MAG: prolyl oligopeptidase family serine peptidase [Melioribacteraceae bacterium]|nr:prolyl oligopeptidase family serine peptidase [Melioribacteraceae bacterium]
MKTIEKLFIQKHEFNNSIKKFFVIIILFGLIDCSSETLIKNSETKQLAKTFIGKYEKLVKLNYLLYLPKDYEQKEKHPLMLFLHGAGERGDNLELVKTHGPAKLVEQGKEFPFVIVSPQCPKDKRWEPTDLIALIDYIITNYKIDENRIYVTGLSMGGNGTWKLAAEIPNRLAAIIPICGWGDPFSAMMMGKLPVWVFHGAKDVVVPLSSSEVMVESIKRSGGNVKFTVYPDANHDSWTETYNNQEIYDWLLNQSLDKR